MPAILGGVCFSCQVYAQCRSWLVLARILHTVIHKRSSTALCLLLPAAKPLLEDCEAAGLSFENEVCVCVCRKNEGKRSFIGCRVEFMEALLTTPNFPRNIAATPASPPVIISCIESNLF